MDVKTGSILLATQTDKELQAMNQLLSDRQYRIKAPVNFLKPDRTDKVNPDFLLYTLNDYIGHIQQCVTSTRKMLPLDRKDDFLQSLAKADPIASGLLVLTASMDVPAMTRLLVDLQHRASEATIPEVAPFVKTLFRFLIKGCYLGGPVITRKYKNAYACLINDFVPSDPDGLRRQVSSATEEWYYILDKVIPGLYPLVLRYVSPEYLSFQQLFYAHGSKVLSWLDVSPSEVLIQRGNEPEIVYASSGTAAADVEEERPPEIPEEVQKGLHLLERLFPEAGWNNLENYPDFCPYFLSMLEFQDAFIQLAPDNPLHFAMILFWILEELFQGLRLIKFERLEPESAVDDIEDINTILDDWILYQESIFDKQFSVDLKSFTHQIYTQPDFGKSPYGRKLLSNMYSLIKNMFLPYFDIRMYGSSRLQKDDRIPPFYVRVRRLERLLSRYSAEIHEFSVPDPDPESSVPGIGNPWMPYKFAIPNALSVRLDALCGGRHSKKGNNAYLIETTFGVLSVLDWWVNDKESPAYRKNPEHLYRVLEPGSSVPAFGVKARTDIDALFAKTLRAK